jgi:hypothetical protein
MKPNDFMKTEIFSSAYIIPINGEVHPFSPFCTRGDRTRQQKFTSLPTLDKMTNKPACQGKGEWQWTTDTC